MATCDDCSNYRTQRGLTWCREGLRGPTPDARACPAFDDVDGPVAGRHVCAPRCERGRAAWEGGKHWSEVARTLGITSRAGVSKQARMHGWTRVVNGGWGGARRGAGRRAPEA